MEFALPIAPPGNHVNIPGLLDLLYLL